MYVSWGKYSTKNRSFSSEWYFQYHVKPADKLLDSLVKRGLVRESNDDELADCLGLKEIQTILKRHNEKPGNEREQSKKKLRELLSGAEIYKECGYRYYVLTEFGEEALENQRIAEGKHLELWKRFRPDKSAEKLRPEQITMVEDKPSSVKSSSQYELYIDTKTETSRLYMMSDPPELLIDENNRSRIHGIFRSMAVKVFFDSCLIANVENVDSYQILHAPRLLILAQNIEKNVLCRCYDFESRSLIAESTIPHGIYSNGLIYEVQTEYNHLGDESERIIEGDFYSYYFSIHDGLAEEILNKHISRFADVMILDSLISGDTTRNYRITVHKNKRDIRETLMFMFVDGRLGFPMIMNAPVNRIMKTLMCRSDDTVIQALYDEHSTVYDHEILMVTKRLLREYSSNASEAIAALHGLFPYRVLCTYDKADLYDIDFSYRGIVKHYSMFSDHFQKLLVQLREEGLIDIRWVSEFSLYMLTKRFYEHCIYQCKFDWLGQQSLDIYVPELNVGIEYQGQQHYEPVDIFGGKEGLQKTQERDERKRKLCFEKGIKLVYWPYTLEVNVENFKKMIGIP